MLTHREGAYAVRLREVQLGTIGIQVQLNERDMMAFIPKVPVAALRVSKYGYISYSDNITSWVFYLGAHYNVSVTPKYWERDRIATIVRAEGETWAWSQSVTPDGRLVALGRILGENKVICVENFQVDDDLTVLYRPDLREFHLGGIFKGIDQYYEVSLDQERKVLTWPEPQVIYIDKVIEVPVEKIVEVEKIVIREVARAINTPVVTVNNWNLDRLDDGREFRFFDGNNPDLGYQVRVWVDGGSFYAEIKNSVGVARTGARRPVVK
jgi:hypothetical protein